MPSWTELPIPASEKLREVAGDRLIRKLYAEFNTEDDGDREALDEYLLRPLEVLMGRSSNKHLSGMEIDGVDPSWRVSTVILNHHRGLNPRINMFTATVSTEEKTVYQEVYKQNE